MRIARTLLFVPALRADQIVKALASSADEVIVDLEDAVTANDKESAREILRNLQPARSCFVRINSCSSSEFADDLGAIAGRRWLKSVVVPKVETAADIRKVRKGLGDSTGIIALIESALGIENAMEIAHSGVSRLAFGGIDYSVQLATEPNDSLFMYPRSRLVVASAARDLAPPIDGPSSNFRDDDVVREAASLARSLGMGGKFCIHPKQLAIVKECFLYSSSERSWASAVLEGLVKSPSGVFVVDGQMIDAPLVARAKEILGEALDVK